MIPTVRWCACIWSFNPCSLGCCSESHFIPFPPQLVFRFQSLFSWMLLWKFGNRSTTAGDSQFQSLFSWMLLWKWPRPPVPLVQVQFQSLFSWMLLWKSAPIEYSPSRLGGFNPCSLGCCSESSSERPRRPSGRVSILVLLDVALKGVHSISARNQRCPVSILVLLDVALKDRYQWMAPHSPKGFNPCSLGCCSESRRWSAPTNRSASFNPCSLGCCSESQRRVSD